MSISDQLIFSNFIKDCLVRIIFPIGTVHGEYASSPNGEIKLMNCCGAPFLERGRGGNNEGSRGKMRVRGWRSWGSSARGSGSTDASALPGSSRRRAKHQFRRALFKITLARDRVRSLFGLLGNLVDKTTCLTRALFHCQGEALSVWQSGRFRSLQISTRSG